MVAGAAGAALVAMVMRICAANPKYSAQRAAALDLAGRADHLREAFSAGRLIDEGAFESVVAAQSLPKGTDDQKAARSEALEAALTAAATEPLRGMERAIGLLHVTTEALNIRNPHLVSDLGCAGELAIAALNACAYNVRVNHRYMKKRPTIDSQAESAAQHELESEALIAAIRGSVAGELAR